MRASVPPLHTHTQHSPGRKTSLPPRAEPPGGLTGWGREAAPRPAALPSCLAHQLVPRDGAEEGVGLELGDSAAAGTQTPLGVVLQELQGKDRRGAGKTAQGGLRPASGPVLPPKPLTWVSSDAAARLSPSGRCSWV